MTFQQAWEQALYGDDGFYRREAPAQHFRTSVHASKLFATAIVRLARAVEAECVTDVGAGWGELGLEIKRQAPDLTVHGVELDDVLPDRLTGLIIANEWLDNLTCPVVELDPEGFPRYLRPTRHWARLSRPMTFAGSTTGGPSPCPAIGPRSA
jgi:SAM-dependent MidA family methyltransferase